MTTRFPIVVALLGLGAALGCGGCGSDDQQQASPAPPPEEASHSGAEAPPGETDEASSEDEVSEVLEGRASYYADSLAGNRTASGEPYDPAAYTAASRDLPFGTRVRVTRLDAEGQPMGSVVVRVNDRGPHRDHSRILDLSRAAAEELDMIRAGVIDIRAEVLAP